MIDDEERKVILTIITAKLKNLISLPDLNKNIINAETLNTIKPWEFVY